LPEVCFGQRLNLDYFAGNFERGKIETKMFPQFFMVDFFFGYQIRHQGFPNISSGTPMTADSTIPGNSAITSSISFGEILWAPL
jgi:hypothetical protein